MIHDVVFAASSATGTWKGNAELTFSRLPVTLDVRADGRDVDAVLSASWAGVTDMHIEDVRFEPPHLDFKADLEDRTISFTGEIHGDNILIGQAEVAGYILPMVLHLR